MQKMLRYGALAAAALLAVKVSAEVLHFRAHLKAANEVHSVTSNASGTVALEFDTTTKAYTAYVTATGLSSALTASHIHEGFAGANGGVVNNFGGASSYITAAGGFAAGKFTGTYAGDVAKLLSEGAYVNVHTTSYPAGEMRGQLVRHVPSTGQFFNVSALSRVEGHGLTIGFSVPREQRVMLRSLGKSLSTFGVPNAVADTHIHLFNSAGTQLAQNDNWKSSQRWTITAAGFWPIDDTDAAIVHYLPAGNYTALIPASRGPGAALLDAFALPEDSLASGLTKAGQFSTLLAAVQAAGLLDVVLGPGPFTLFAPTDAAFAKLPSGTVENLLKPENKATLVAILLYHIVPAKVLSTQLSNGMKANTLNGAQLTVDLTSGVKINTSSVIEADFVVSNGVIHIVDTVILPP